ncbi:MAG: isoprenyl transferase [Deltaproteobacteria bacterium]|nr:isoprenyl transferase [Deltaproteobacteria bacterium]
MKRLNKAKLPRHIAIIMDGNGRWARKHSLKRIAGHKKGAEAVRKVVKTSGEIGIQYLTLYAFSVENWRRPEDEINALMSLLEEFLVSELREMLDTDIRLRTIGDITKLPEQTRKILLNTIEQTSHNSGMTLNLALSYGGRDEMVEAVKKIILDKESGRIRSEEITKELFSEYLYTADIPDPDLLIRTSGEYRLSNFLLWQSAYTELCFIDILWPDFTGEYLIDIIADYQNRERRFGMISDQLP